MATASPFAKLTPYRESILRLAESEGAICHKDVARDQPTGGFQENARTAAKQLKALHAMGFLAPVRNCEFKLTPLGQTWLDNRRDLEKV